MCYLCCRCSMSKVLSFKRRSWSVLGLETIHTCQKVCVLSDFAHVLQSCTLSGIQWVLLSFMLPCTALCVCHLSVVPNISCLPSFQFLHLAVIGHRWLPLVSLYVCLQRSSRSPLRSPWQQLERKQRWYCLTACATCLKRPNSSLVR